MADSSQLHDTSIDEAIADDLPAEPTEQQLRDAFDSDEIDRFLRLFSTYVQEVTVLEPVPGEVKGEEAPKDSEHPNEEGTSHRTTEDEFFGSPQDTSTRTISEGIVKKWLVPCLPPPRPTPQSFSIQKLSVTAQRLYLTTQEPYTTFFNTIFKLATWKDFQRSLFWCSTYWILWWHNLLLSGVVLGVLGILLKRKVFLYPSLEELQQHREQVINSSKFGRQMSDRLSTPAFGLQDFWHMFKLIETSRKRKAGSGDTKSKPSTVLEDLSSQLGETVDETTVLDDDPDSKNEQNLKKMVLLALSEIADLHERVRNIFIWRRPSVSTRYAIALSIVFCLTLLPPQYLYKLTLFVVGAVFWHLVPIIAALSSEEKSRLPPMFGDAPTDAEYAMELISGRVAAGLEVRPRLPARRNRGQQQQNAAPRDQDNAPRDSPDLRVDWKKWGERLHTGKAILGKVTHPNLGQTPLIHEESPGQHATIPNLFGSRSNNENSNHTYPCQHSSSPGLITLSPTSFFFTPLMSQVPTVSFPLSSVKGIKKQGVLKGLQIKWSDESDGLKTTKEDKFIWVGSRDDLFARLVGTNGQRWATL